MKDKLLEGAKKKMRPVIEFFLTMVAIFVIVGGLVLMEKIEREKEKSQSKAKHQSTKR